MLCLSFFTNKALHEIRVDFWWPLVQLHSLRRKGLIIKGFLARQAWRPILNTV